MERNVFFIGYNDHFDGHIFGDFEDFDLKYSIDKIIDTFIENDYIVVKDINRSGRIYCMDSESYSENGSNKKNTIPVHESDIVYSFFKIVRIRNGEYSIDNKFYRIVTSSKEENLNNYKYISPSPLYQGVILVRKDYEKINSFSNNVKNKKLRETFRKIKTKPYEIGNKNNIYKGDTIIRVDKRIRDDDFITPGDIVLGKAEEVYNNGGNERHKEFLYNTKDEKGKKINYDECIKGI